MPPKKVVKPKYNNPALELTQRAYLGPNDAGFKAMIDTMWDHFKKDKNSEFKFFIEKSDFSQNYLFSE